MRHLFAYGTLMCPEIFTRICGIEQQGIPASLEKHRRYAVRDGVFPAIVPAANGKVDGLLYCELNDLVWNRIDRFEGDLYERRTVRVNLDIAEMVEAEVYVLHNAYRHRLSHKAWDFEHFLKYSTHIYLGRK